MALIKGKNRRDSDRQPEHPTLGDADPTVRLAAAHELGEHGTGVAELLALVPVEKDPAVRQSALSALAEHDTVEIAQALVPMLHSDDAPLRNAVLEALRVMPWAVAQILPELLDDPDPDVRILAGMLMVDSHHHDTRPRLEAALAAEQHPNVVAALLEAYLHIQDAASRPVLTGLRDRFPDNPFLAYTIDTALKQSEP